MIRDQVDVFTKRGHRKLRNPCERIKLGSHTDLMQLKCHTNKCFMKPVYGGSTITSATLVTKELFPLVQMASYFKVQHCYHVWLWYCLMAIMYIPRKRSIQSVLLLWQLGTSVSGFCTAERKRDSLPRGTSHDTSLGLWHCGSEDVVPPLLALLCPEMSNTHSRKTGVAWGSCTFW